MAKAQGKKAAAGAKSAAKKVAARVKSAVGAVKKKAAAPKAKPAAKAKPAPKAAAKPAPKPAPKKPAAKPAKPAKAAAKVVKKAAKAVTKAAKTAVAKVTPKAAPKAVAPKAVAPKAAAPKAAAPKAVAPKAPAKATPALKPPATKAASKATLTVAPSAVPPTTVPSAPAAPNAPSVVPADDKKRSRRGRIRVTSNGAPAASWLTATKPRAASFIPAPPRAEAPSAIAAPPASSDRLFRPEEVMELAVRTVPVRVDIEQGAGRFYVIASPQEVSLRPGEGIEWDFRYLGGADVNVEEVVVEFERPSPFAQHVFRTRKPGGARPHRQLSGGAQASAVGKRVQCTIRAMTPFKTELANARVFINVLP